MTSEEYWAKRQELLMDALMAQADGYTERVADGYAQVIARIRKEIEAFYARYASENGMTYADAKRLLTSDERDALRMEVQDYIAKGETLEYTKAHATELRRASTVHRISRLEGLELLLAQQIEELAGRTDDTLKTALRAVYEEGYQRQVFRLGGTHTPVHVEVVNKLLAKPWAADGKTFSDRVWDDVPRLQGVLETTLAQGLIRGDSVQTMTKAVADTMGSSRKSAERLVRTEASAVAAQATEDCYKAVGIDEFQFVATLDERTCPICGAIDLQHFPRNEYRVGTNANPLHPNCRCTTAPYMDDEEWRAYLLRTAIDPETGERVTVTGTVSYEQWKAGMSPEARQKMDMTRARKRDEEQWRRYKGILPKEMPKTLDEFQALKYNRPGEWAALKDHYYTKSRLQDGRWGSAVNADMQAPHMEVTAAAGKSYLYNGVDPQKLFDQYAGTGRLERTAAGRPTNREMVIAGAEIGILLPSGRVADGIKIHHSKTRTHIVPYSEKGR